MLNVTRLGHGVVKGQIRYGFYIWMRNLAMITFVIVICEGFPVVIALHAPDVIELIFREVKMFEPLLGVNPLKVVCPFHFWFWGRIQVDPDEANGIDVHMDRKEAMVLFVERRDGVEARGLGKFSVYTVRPAVIFAGEDLGVSRLFCDDWKGSVPADVVEAVDGLSVFVQAQHKSIACLLEAEKVSRLGEA